MRRTRLLYFAVILTGFFVFLALIQFSATTIVIYNQTDQPIDGLRLTFSQGDEILELDRIEPNQKQTVKINIGQDFFRQPCQTFEGAIELRYFDQTEVIIGYTFQGKKDFATIDILHITPQRMVRIAINQW